MGMKNKVWIFSWMVIITINCFGNDLPMPAIGDTGVIILTTNDPRLVNCQVTCGGTIIENGGLPIIEYGVCWSMNASPTVIDNHTSNCWGPNPFNCYIPLQELDQCNGLYFRAYATNDSGTYYGDAKTLLLFQSSVFINQAILELTPTSITFQKEIFGGNGGTLTCQSNLYPPGYHVCSNNCPINEICQVENLNPSTSYVIVTNVVSSCAGCDYFTHMSMDNLYFTTPPLITTTPTFSQIGPLCENSSAPRLPFISNNGITGSWSPETISSAASGTYVFTPDADQGATTTTLDIVVIPAMTSTTGVTICSNQLPYSWNNTSFAVAGAYDITLISKVTGCDSIATLNLMAVIGITPTFPQIGPLYQNSTPPLLPLTSNNGITGSWNPATISTSASGTYVFIPDNWCDVITTMTIEIMSQTSIEESNSVYKFSVYPNPNNGEFQIICEFKQQKDVSIKVIDNLGKQLYYAGPKKYIGKIDKTIKLSDLSSGIYLLIVRIDNEIITKNIAVQK